MAKRVKVVSIFKGAQGVSNYEVGAEMKKQNVKGEWESLGKKVKKIEIGKNSVEIFLSDKTSIFFRDFPIAVDYI
jgi:hypothetical protein